MSYKVGDKLAFFRSGFGERIHIHEITKVTPSGRMTCGRYTLNPDLTIRGKTDRWGPYKAEPVTPEIERKYVRQMQLGLIAGTKFEELSDEKLASVVVAIGWAKASGANNDA